MSGFSESTAPQGGWIFRIGPDGGLLEHRDSEAESVVGMPRAG